MRAQLRPGFNWLTPAFLFGSAAYLYANLFSFPTVPFLLGGDQVFYWMYAQRMLRGERIYEDFFQLTPPGADLLYAAAFKLLGSKVWVPNVIVLILGLTLCWGCFRISQAIMGRTQSLLASSFFLVLIYGKLLNATHHWFSLLAVMGSLAVLMKARTSTRVAVAGVLLGLASFFTQTRGVSAALGIALFLVWEHFRKKETWPGLFRRLMILLVAFVASLTILSSYFIVTEGIGRLWYFQGSYVLHYKVEGLTSFSLGLPETFTWKRLPEFSQYLFVYALLPSVYAITLWRSWRHRHDAPSLDADRSALLAMVGLVISAEVAHSPNWLRVYCVALPAIVLFIWILGKARVRRPAYFLIGAAIIGLAFYQTWFRHHQTWLTVELPAGRAMAPPSNYEKAEWMMHNMNSGEQVFLSGWPGLYLPLGLIDPIYLDVLETDEHTRPQDVEQSIRELDAKQVRYILWETHLDSPAPLESPASYHLAEFGQYMRSHYRRVGIFSNGDEMWKRW